MEPQFEQKLSVEFDANEHHILNAESVVFALTAVAEKNEQGGVSDVEYIQWIQELLSGNEAFALRNLRLDAQALEAIVRGGDDDAYITHGPTLLEIAKDMRQSYETNAYETVTELNAFLLKNPSLFLWSTNPEDTIDEIIVETRQDGDIRPVAQGSELFIDVTRLSEKYRTLVAASAL